MSQPPRSVPGSPAAGGRLRRAARALRRPRLVPLALACVALAVGLPSAAAGAGGEVVDEVHYTFTGPGSVAFDWRGSATDIRYGLDASYGSAAPAHDPTPWPGSSPGPFREVELTGLQAGTTYHYSIGGGPDHTFHTAPTGDFTFDVEADVGSSRDVRMAMTQADIAADTPSFVLVPGDLTYADQYGTSAVDRHFDDVMAWSQTAAYMPAWGNHEWPSSGADDLRDYKGRFMLPHAQPASGAPAPGCCGEDWSWFDAGGVRFISYPEPYSSTTWDGWKSAAETVFAAAQGDDSIRYILTFGHRPAYSTGSHSGDSHLATILDGFGDTYSKYVLNLNGHSHDYERFQPIHGVIHVTTGGGGEDQETTSTPPAPRTVVRALHLEHLRVSVNSAGMTVEAVCGADSRYEDRTCTRGEDLDKFTIAAPRPAPVVRVRAPADGSTTASGTPAFTGTAGTAETVDTAGTAVKDSTTVDLSVYAGTTPTGTPVQTPMAAVQSDGTWSVSAAPALADGTYTVTATQTGAGGTTTSPPSTFTVASANPDTTAPASAATSPATSAGTVTVAYTSSDDGGSGLSTVQLYVRPPGANGWALADTRSAPGAGGSFDYPADAGDGTYGFYTVATDRAGNREDPPPPVSGTLPAPDTSTSVTLPPVAPPAIASPADGAYSTTGAVTVGGSAPPGAELVLSDSGTVVTSAPVATDGTWASTVSGLADGVHEFKAKATSGSLVTSSSSNGVSVTVDTVPPSSQAGAAGSSTSTSIPVSWSAQDSGSGVARVELWARPPGAPGFALATFTDPAGAGSDSFTYTAAAGEGTYAFYTVAIDKAGNREDAPATPDATTTLDTTPPAVVVNAPPADGSIADTTPTFSGTAGTAAGDVPTVTIAVYAGATATGSPAESLEATPDPSTGAWSVDADKALGPGQYTVVASQGDAAGNTGTSVPRTFTIDTAEPVVSLAQPADDSTTSVASPVLSGSAGTLPGDFGSVDVQLYTGSSAAGTAFRTRSASVDPSTGAWSVDAGAALSDGPYTAVAVQHDAAGNTGSSTAHTFTVDTTGPGVTLVHPADGAVTDDATPTLDGAAGTAPGDASAVTVEIHAGSTLDGPVVQAPSATRDATTGAWTIDAPTLQEGTYTARASQQDAVGNTGHSAAHTFTIDTTPPTVSLVHPAAALQTNDQTPTFDGAADTAPGALATVTVSIFAGDTPGGPVVETLEATRDASTGAWSAGANSALDPGTYTAQASQDDAAGNTGRSAAHVFTIDTTAPTVTLGAPADGSRTNVTAPTFDGTASTAPGDAPTVVVDVFAGTSATGAPLDSFPTTRDPSTGAFSVAAGSALDPGTYTARASQSDTAGNTGHSGAHTFVIDTTPPTITLVHPSDGASTADTTPTLDGTAGTGPGDLPSVTVRIYAGATPSGSPVQTRTATRNASTGAWTIAATALAEGKYTATASQADSAGNSHTSAAHTFTVDTTAPVVTVVHPADGSSTRDTTPTLDGTAGIAEGDAATIIVEIHAGTSVRGAGEQTLMPTRDPSTGAWSVDARALGEGAHTVVAIQDDAAGNDAESTAHTFTVDTTAPAVTLVDPPDGSTTGDATPTLDGAGATAPGDGPSVAVAIHSGTDTGGAVVQSLTATRDPSTGAWSVDSPGLRDGTYTAVAAQADAAGNTGSSSPHTFTVDTQAPAITLTYPADGARTADTTPTFDGTASLDADAQVTVSLWAGGSAGGPPDTTYMANRDPTTGAWSADATAPLPDGPYTVQASQQDGVGHTGTSAAHTFTVDTTAPVVTLLAPADGSATNDTTPSVSGTGGHAAGDASTVTVVISAGGAPVRTLDATPDAVSGAWSVAPGGALPEGDYTVRATQDDAAGNTGHSATAAFTVDTTPPGVTLDQPASGAVTNDTTPTIDGTAGRAKGDGPTVTVSVFGGATASGTPLETRAAGWQAGTGAWSLAADPPLPDGTYTIDAAQGDAAANRRTTAAHTFAVDTKAPSSAATAATASGGGLVVGYAAADRGAAGLATIDLYARDPRGGAFHLAGERSSPAATGSFAYPAHGAGTYAFYTVAEDRAGNREAAPADPQATVTLQPPPPLPPKLTATLRSSGTQRIGRVLRTGIVLSLRCNAPCAATLVARAGARRMQGRSVIGRLTARLTRAGQVRQLRIRIKGPARRPLAALRKLSVRIDATVTPTRSGPARHVVRTVELRR